jgi:hypothetical protein
MINAQSEWSFIQYEVHNRKPEGYNYQGMDLCVREILFNLQILLSKYEHGNNLENDTIVIEYTVMKNAYLRLINWGLK